MTDFYTNKFKPFRNKIQKYNRRALVELAIHKLHEIELKSGSEIRDWLPWNLLYIIKVALILGNNYTNRVPSMKDLATLNNKLIDFTSEHPILKTNEEHKIYKFLRLTAHQQFWIQEKIGSWVFGKNLVLYNETKGRFNVTEYFQNKTGLSIEEFFQLSFAVFSILNTNKSYIINEQTFKNYTGSNVKKYFELLSITFDNAENKLKSYAKVHNIEGQFYEQTPLKYFPFIKQDQQNYWIVSKKIFEETIEHYIYDFLKAEEPEKFSESFGEVFENYLDTALKNSKCEYLNEAEIQALFQNKSYVVDFLMKSPNGTVLIESKAIEMTQRARTNQSNQILTNELKSSVIKAIKQAYSVANQITTHASLNLSPNIFVLIITYKELHLGPFKMVWDELFGEVLEEFFKQSGIQQNIIPPEKIFCISSGCFDILINILRNTNHSIDTILNKAVADNADPKTLKWLLDQSLDENFPCSASDLPYLQEPYEKAIEELVVKFGGSKGKWREHVQKNES